MMEFNLLWEMLTESRRRRFLKVLEERTRYITVVLEDIFDPHNGSACLRSCEANGIQDIYIIERERPFTTKEGVSMGSGKWLTLHKFSNTQQDPTVECLKVLSQKNYRIYGMSSYEISGKVNRSLQELSLSQPVALVFGSERNGLSNVALEHINEFIQIPMYGFVESYNISVACAIAVYTLVQNLRNTNYSWRLSKEEKQEVLWEWLKKEFPDHEKILKNQIKSF
ncbi:MAG: RNA methyltransferase [Leptospiraceae bacterium]|nr:RNA methyltransferase [Leptospiraceae bacterium]MDW7975129.1 RNA methyltransferase [Leptospiraceae bacterium]